MTEPICASCGRAMSIIRWSTTADVDGPVSKGWWCLNEECNCSCPSCGENLLEAMLGGTRVCSNCDVHCWLESTYYLVKKKRVEGEPSPSLEPERIWELVSSLRQLMRDVNALVGAIEGVKGNGLYDTERSRVATVVLGSVQRMLDEEASSLSAILADEAGFEAEWRTRE